MKRIGCALLLFLLPLCAIAQDGIHRCIGADGNPLFTDQPCAALQATPVATPTPSAKPPVTQAVSTIPTTTPPPVSCATSVAELRQGMIDAFAARDPNRLAGLMIWNGYGRDAVVADIRSLGSLMQRPLLDIGTASENEGPPASSDDPLFTSPGADATRSPPASAGDQQLVVRTASADASGVAHETRFGVVRRSGCLWLRASG
ncbi:hypothetical protein [Dyella japonica]|uniref:DUF4124 domain-containing protein n=1 Tax=Dyella japonica DSM 16301 TaxID=1440762 RepID=A0A0G9H083_9GAMM|nr:hypothetical protein [Dyella japonica]KLD63215.1 hypothetical protein Y882_12455 [Dyella japonica DSM 16301]